MNSWAEISEHHLLANYRALLRTAGPGLPVLAVIKADAYGHSAELCAPLLARAGAPWLGVTDAAEGARVRQALTAAGIPAAGQPEILVMCGPAPEDAATTLQHRLTPVLWNAEGIAPFERAAAAADCRLNLHLELDTGMSRQGATAGPAFTRVLTLLASSRHLRVSGVLTHLASAEVANAAHTREQIAELGVLLAEIARHGLRPDWFHIGNTSTLDNPSLVSKSLSPGSPLAWVHPLAGRIGARPMLRSGLALYGHTLPLAAEREPQPEAPLLRPLLHPVLTWKTRIRSLTDIPHGAAIGYNASFRATRPTRLALLPVGYADGLRRDLSASDTHPGGWTILHGQRAHIVGRVSMNLTTVDVTDIPEASVGDEVTLLGPGISAEDHATLARTIPYDILCGLRPDIRRLTGPAAAFAPAGTTPVASL